MNLIEAVKSGKPFKRRGDDHWIVKLVETWIGSDKDDPDAWGSHAVMTWSKTSGSDELRLEDLLADDWEIKSEN